MSPPPLTSLHADWRPDEFGLKRALALACAPVLCGVVVLQLVLAGFAPPPLAPPVTVELAEPAPSPASVPTAEPAIAPSEASPFIPDAAVPPPPELAKAELVPVQAISAQAIDPPPAPPVQPPAPLVAMADTPSELPLAPILPTLAEPVADPSPPQSQARQAPRPVPPRPRPARLPHPQPTEASTAFASLPSPSSLAPATSAAPPSVAPSPVAAPPIDTSSGLGPYRAGLHAQIQRNLLADEAVRRLGVGGAATIEAVIAPDGRVLSASVARSSGNRAIDLAARSAVERGGYRAFGAHMPAGPITISVPIAIGDD